MSDLSDHEKKFDMKEEDYKIMDEYPLQKPDPEEIPEPSIWPIGLAFGVLLIFWGFIASLGLTMVGIVVFGVSLAGWVSDLKP